MIVHFVKDEKVTDQIVENFGNVGENVFLIFSSVSSDQYIYVSSISDRLRRFDKERENINDVLDFYLPSAIIIHGLQNDFIDTILKIDKKIKLGWYAWGFDIYGLPKIRPEIYAKLTDNYLLQSDKSLATERFIKRYKSLRRLYYLFIKRIDDPYSKIEKIFGKTNFFVSYMEEDFKLFSKHYSYNMKFFNCAFSTIDQYLAGNADLELYTDAENILIGNSNTPESNHLDALEIIAKSENNLNQTTNIYAPLSYGKNDGYKKAVNKIGHELFGSSFSPLLDFMDRKSYIAILQSCSVGVFYHYRQQGMGNIIAMIYLGCRVYLSPINPVYHFLLRNGVKVFNLDIDFSEFGIVRLNNEEVYNNRTVLKKLFSRENVLRNIVHLYQELV